MVVTFFLTFVSTFVFSSLLVLLVMKRSGNTKAQSKLQKQSEPVEENTAEAEYEVIDHNKKGVTLKENPAYSIHAYK